MFESSWNIASQQRQINQIQNTGTYSMENILKKTGWDAVCVYSVRRTGLKKEIMINVMKEDL